MMCIRYPTSNWLIVSSDWNHLPTTWKWLKPCLDYLLCYLTCICWFSIDLSSKPASSSDHTPSDNTFSHYTYICVKFQHHINGYGMFQHKNSKVIATRMWHPVWGGRLWLWLSVLLILQFRLQLRHCYSQECETGKKFVPLRLWIGFGNGVGERFLSFMLFKNLFLSILYMVTTLDRDRHLSENGLWIDRIYFHYLCNVTMIAVLTFPAQQQ